jgi:hypothetical protein
MVMKLFFIVMNFEAKTNLELGLWTIWKLG